MDLDGTLAHYEGWNGVNHIGAPLAPMVERVKKWLAAGKTVKIFTARMHGHGMPIIGGEVEDVETMPHGSDRYDLAIAVESAKEALK